MRRFSCNKILRINCPSNKIVSNSIALANFKTKLTWKRIRHKNYVHELPQQRTSLFTHIFVTSLNEPNLPFKSHSIIADDVLLKCRPAGICRLSRSHAKSVDLISNYSHENMSRMCDTHYATARCQRTVISQHTSWDGRECVFPWKEWSKSNLEEWKPADDASYSPS